MRKQRHRVVEGLGQGHANGKQWGQFKPRLPSCRVHLLDWTFLVDQTPESSSMYPLLDPTSLHHCPALEKHSLQLASCMAPPSLHWPCPSASLHHPDTHPCSPCHWLPDPCMAQLLESQGLPPPGRHPAHSESPQLCRSFTLHGEVLP